MRCDRNTVSAHRYALPDDFDAVSSGANALSARAQGDVHEGEQNDGDVLAIEEDWYLVVEAQPEPVLAALPRDRAEAIRLAFDVGNRHFSLALEGEALLVPDDAAMVQLLTRSGVRWERRQAVFDPIGVGGQGHDEAASSMDGHRHGLAHVHQDRG
jgi:urease accessory protein UreE